MAIENIKLLGAILELQLNSPAIYLKMGQIGCAV